MTTEPSISVITQVPPSPPPVKDTDAAASEVLENVLSCCVSFTNNLGAIAAQYRAEVPTGSSHVLDLAGQFSRSVLAWIEAWPT